MLRLLGMLVLLALAQGCVEYTDEVRLLPGGGGEFQMQIAIPSDIEAGSGEEGDMDFFQVDSLRARFTRIAGVHLDSIGVAENDGKKTMKAYLRFDSLAALALVGGADAEENFLGTVALRTEGKDKVFERVLNANLSQEIPEENTNSLALGMMKGVLGSTYWSYTLVVPGKILEANTTADRIDSAAGRVTWKVLATDVSGKPFQMVVRYREPVKSMGWVSIISLASSFLILAFSLFIMNSKMRRFKQVLAERKAALDSKQ